MLQPPTAGKTASIYYEAHTTYKFLNPTISLRGIKIENLNIKFYANTLSKQTHSSIRRLEGGQLWILCTPPAFESRILVS